MKRLILFLLAGLILAKLVEIYTEEQEWKTLYQFNQEKPWPLRRYTLAQIDAMDGWRV